MDRRKSLTLAGAADEDLLALRDHDTSFYGLDSDLGRVRVASSKLIWKKMSNLGRVEMSSSHSNAFSSARLGEGSKDFFR